MNGILRCKKGTGIGDYILLVVIMFVFAIVIIAGNIVLNDLNTDFQADTDLSTAAKTEMSTQTAKYPSYFDATIVLAFVILWIALLVAAFMLDTNPIFFIILLLVYVSMFFVIAELSNTYEEIMSTDDFATVSGSYPMTNWIFSNFLILSIMVAVSVMLVTFAKSRSA